MASLPQVCGLLPPPERTDALNAVAKTIGLIRRRYLLTAKEIAASLKKDDGTAPIADTIERAERGENLLSFDLIAQIAFIYRECADPVRMLLEPAATGEPTTLEQRLERAEQEILAVRRELASSEANQ
jgi:hypothetical protein